mmetsp:Transcript_48648/g.54401  ORF Transcript_48648/g.54401 Transcript_48648/m.54401 type:complete len:87 (+) Transcript_48648:14-274(+)
MFRFLFYLFLVYLLMYCIVLFSIISDVLLRIPGAGFPRPLCVLRMEKVIIPVDCWIAVAASARNPFPSRFQSRDKSDPQSPLDRKN